MTREDALGFYTGRHGFSELFLISPGQKRITLGDRLNGHCRFCVPTPREKDLSRDAPAWVARIEFFLFERHRFVCRKPTREFAELPAAL